MTISKDLFLAILSLDSYNRGYGTGITLDGSQVGSAKIGLTSTDPLANIPNGVAAGFYAVSYTVGAGVDDIAAGTTVISYRGTDFTPSTDFYTDIANGWAIGGGDYRAPQLELSSAFLENVAKNGGTVVDQAFVSSIILTGHSLGGTLAGLNSRLYGQQAMVLERLAA